MTGKEQLNPMSRIRELRKERGLTLADLAKATGTTPQTIQRLELGNMTLSLRWMRKIAEVLKVPPHTLVQVREETSADEAFIALLRAEIVRARRNALAATPPGLALLEASGNLAEGLAEWHAGLRQWQEVTRLAAATAAVAMCIGVDGHHLVGAVAPAMEAPRQVRS